MISDKSQRAADGLAIGRDDRVASHQAGRFRRQSMSHRADERRLGRISQCDTNGCGCAATFVAINWPSRSIDDRFHVPGRGKRQFESMRSQSGS